jgi:hypothetical protein
MVRAQQWLFAAGVSLLAATLTFIPAGSPRALPAGPRRGLSHQSEGGKICPLSEQQEEEAPKAFAAMVPTFTHPRCINCHGAVNPFEPNTPHVSGRVGKTFKQVSMRDDILGRDVQVTVVDVEDSDHRWDSCKDCHSAFPGIWALPPPSKWFTGKSALQLCEQMKSNFSSAGNFLEHVEHDVGPFPFIEEGFKGTRGLDENGQATYQNVTGKDFQPEPPPITHEQFIDQAKAWVDAMGGEFTGEKDCGCQPHKYALELKYRLLYQEPGDKLASEAKAILPVKFVKFKEFTAEGGTELKMLVSHHDPVMDCKDSYMQFNPHWQATGTVAGPDYDPSSKLQLKFTLNSPPGYIAPATCTVHGKTSTTPGMTTPGYTGYTLPPVEMDATVGSETTITPGPSQKADVTLIEEK